MKKKSTQAIIDFLNLVSLSLENGTMTSKQLEVKFTKSFSKEQLQDCLTDISLDADDMVAIKEMLKTYFNYELVSN